MKNELKSKYYGRYVDDFFIVHKDKKYLLSLIKIIDTYLETNLQLTLHPNKIHLQHYSKGVLFLWVFVKPYRTYIRKRTIWFFYNKINELNNRLELENEKVNNTLLADFLSCINSYLWLIKHHKSYKIRKKMLENNINKEFWKYFYISEDYTVIRKRSGLKI